MHQHPVIVAGMDCIAATGQTLAMTLKALDDGLPSPVFPTWYTGAESPVFQCQLPSLYTQQPYSRTVGLLQHTLTNALAHANLSADQIRPFNVGVCIGTSVGASLNFYQSYKALRANTPPPLDDVRLFAASNPSLAIAQLYQCTGPVLTITNACSSGTDAIGMAADWVRNGLCDIVIAGGGDELSEVSYTGFSSLMLTSSTPCKPFDKHRNGLNLGEGAGVMLLVSNSVAKKLDIAPQGYILGYGTCTDAHHLTAPHPEGLGLKKAIYQALYFADLSINDIAFINAHATATPTNDKVEGKCLYDLFPSTPIVATKGSTGHTLGAAGAIEAVITLAHLKRQYIPKTPGFSAVDPEITLAPTRQTTHIHGSVALSQSLAFGGNNSAILLGSSLPHHMESL